MASLVVTTTVDLEQEIARLQEENAQLLRAHLEQQRAVLLEERARLQSFVQRPPGFFAAPPRAPPGLEAPFAGVDATLLAMAMAAGQQGGKFGGSYPPTDAGSLASSVLTSDASSFHSECEIVSDVEGRTTLILRNIPNSYTRQQLLELIDSLGFAGCYDFLYLPIDFNTFMGFGYAFVNFVDEASADSCIMKLQGYRAWLMPSEKVLSVDWCSSHQGLSSHVERYRNSPIMHESVADESKPMLFKAGIRVAFPRPTRKLKLPRTRTELK